MAVRCAIVSLDVFGLICLLFIVIFVSVISRYTGYYAPHPFGCGSDEFCHCDASEDCLKKKVNANREAKSGKV